MGRLIALVCALAMLIAVVGCSTSRTYSTPGGKVTVKKNGPLGKEHTVEVESKEGKARITGGSNSTITEAELGVPVYPGAKAQMAGKYESNQPAGGEALEHYMLATEDSYDKVVAFYKSKLTNVKSSSSHSSGDMRMTMFNTEKGTQRIAINIAWDSKEKQTMIQVMKAQAK